jgi:hypothetical protein
MKKLLLLCAMLPLELAYAAEPWSYQLQGKTLFENEIDSHYCEKLHVQGNFLFWVTSLADTGKSIVFRKCMKTEEPYQGATSPGSIYGSVEEGWYELQKEPNAQTRKLTLPRLNEFSNPSYCGSNVAYWGADNNDSYFAVVYDLKRRKTVKDQKIGSVSLSTDDMYILNQPNWAEDCSHVTFKDKHFRRKVKYLF